MSSASAVLLDQLLAAERYNSSKNKFFDVFSRIEERKINPSLVVESAF
jgi:hypothetical protein